MSFSGFNMKDLIPKDLLPKDLRQKISEHMDANPSELPIVSEEFETYDHPNLQVALDEITEKDDKKASVLGLQAGLINSFAGISLADLVAPPSMSHFVGLGGAKEGSVQYTNITIDGGQKLACVMDGLYLLHGNPRLVILLRRATGFQQNRLKLEVMAKDRTTAESFIKDVQRLMGKRNVYRGKLLSVQKTDAVALSFHALPKITRDKIILPEGLLKRIERQTVDAVQYSDALKKAGKKLKRGILLHGKPGTGKTLTAMFLASEMQGRTVLIITGRGQGLIERSCFFARWLAPAMVVIEDVDLIAEDRSVQGSCENAVLMELLNEMDGLAEDIDVLFVLTTNRPEILEPALASRPGRIDQAYEVPLPDAECRRRLFDLYSQGLIMKVDNIDDIIKRTSGASAAFISELLRKAALFAAPDGDPIVVTDRHLDEAIHEMVVAGGSLTRNLLGSRDIGYGIGSGH